MGGMGPGGPGMGGPGGPGMMGGPGGVDIKEFKDGTMVGGTALVPLALRPATFGVARLLDSRAN